MKKKYFKKIFFCLALVFFLNPFWGRTVFVNASSSVGTIDNVYKYAKGVDSNNIKINFGLFKGTVNVTVTDQYLTGFAWGENIGWINLSPSNGGVVNNGKGVLSGIATSEFGGAVNFKVGNSGVTINSSGDFLGYAVSEKFGRISFNCLNDNSCAIDDYKVRTDWRPASMRDDNENSVPVAPVVPSDDTSPIVEKPVEKKILPLPLPIIDIGQYEGGGDVIKYNEKRTDLNGEIKQVMPGEDSLINEENIKNTIEKEIINKDNTSSDNVIFNISQKTKEFGSLVKEKSKEIKKEAEIVTSIKAVDISTKTVTTVGVAGGSTAVLSSFAGSTLTFSELLLNFLRIWSLFMSAVGLRKKLKPWGVVYDSVTKQPLDPAYVVLQDKDNKEVATAITDLDGRFGFLVPLGAYKIYVRKNNYSFPSKKLFGKDSDELYENLYFGEFLDLKQDKLIIKNIPMDPEKFDWNEFTKRSKKLFKFNSPFAYFFAKISNVLFYLGFILALLLIIINGFNYYNLAILFVYGILFILRMIGIKAKSYGLIFEKNTSFPLSFAIVRVFQKNSKKEIFHRVADKFGRYYCLLPNGEYYVSIEKKNSDESYSNVYVSENLIIKKGILNKDFKIS